MTNHDDAEHERELRALFDRTAATPTELQLRRMASRAEKLAPRRTNLPLVLGGALALAAAVAVFVTTQGASPPGTSESTVASVPAPAPAMPSATASTSERPALAADDTEDVDPLLAELAVLWGSGDDLQDDEDPDAWLVASAADLGDELR